jgi:hypothetical protein
MQQFSKCFPFIIKIKRRIRSDLSRHSDTQIAPTAILDWSFEKTGSDGCQPPSTAGRALNLSILKS